MFKEKIKELLAQLEGKRSLVNEKTTEMRSLLTNEEASEDDVNKAKAMRSDIDKLNEEIRSIEDDVKLYRAAEKGNPAPEPHEPNGDDNDEKRAFNDFLHPESAMVVSYRLMSPRRSQNQSNITQKMKLSRSLTCPSW